MTGNDADRGPIRLPRRALLRGTALGAFALGAPAALSGCATSGGGGNDQLERGETSKDNPLGAPAEGPLDVVIFKGGYSDKYAKYHQKMYRREHDAEITHLGTQEITGTQQRRFVNGNPPDVIDNSGAQEMDTFALIDKGQLRALEPLLDAPSVDDPNTTVRDTLIENSLKPLTVDGKVYGINYTMCVSGIWHDRRLFEQHDWEPPTKWDEFVRLAERIKKYTPEIAPFTYQGQYPGYMVTVFHAMAQKHGGTELMRRVDNLEDGAWQQDGIRTTLQALYELKARDLLMKDVSGLTHTQAQNRWANGAAAFVPCGSWLKSEIGSQLPPEFQMALQPTWSIDDSDELPFESCYFYPDETFLVPSDAHNPWGGMEYLRMMLSKEGAQKFAELTYALTIVDGAHDDQEKDVTLQTTIDTLEQARQNPLLDEIMYAAWYDNFGSFVEQQMGQLLTDELDVDGFIEKVQRKADETKKDPNLRKHER